MDVSPSGYCSSQMYRPLLLPSALEVFALQLTGLGSDSLPGYLAVTLQG